MARIKLEDTPNIAYGAIIQPGRARGNTFRQITRLLLLASAREGTYFYGCGNQQMAHYAARMAINMLKAAEVPVTIKANGYEILMPNESMIRFMEAKSVEYRSRGLDVVVDFDHFQGP